MGIENTFIDARELIKTNSRHRNAEVDFDSSYLKIKEIISQDCDLFITQGFVGSDSYGLVTTLGREGSDYSAAIFASLLNAEETVFWKDVPGIYNADPKFYKKAHLIKELSYSDARTLTDLGAKVLHHKTIKPLENSKIPLFINLFELPVKTGTKIHSSSLERNELPVIVHRFNKILLSIKSLKRGKMTNDDSFLIRQMIERQQLEVNYENMGNDVCYISLNHLVEPIIALRDDLRRRFKVEIHYGLCMVKVKNGNDEIIQSILKDVELIHRDQIGDIIYLFY
jgi:aspartate kinase